VYRWLFIFFIAFSQIAFMNILTAIFVNQAIELAKPDRATLAVEHRRKEIEAYEELRTLCDSLDPGDTGRISLDDFADRLRSGPLGARLGILGLNVADTEHFFDLLLFATHAESRDIDKGIFVEGCMRLRGQATGADLQWVVKQTEVIRKMLLSIQEETDKRFSTLSDCLIAALKDSSDWDVGGGVNSEYATKSTCL